MSLAYGEIARVLGGARRRQVWVVVLAAVGFAAAGVAVCLLVGAAALGLGARAWVRAASLAGAGVAVAGPSLPAVSAVTSSSAASI